MHNVNIGQAVRVIERVVSNFNGVSVLTKTDLAIYKQQFTLGWEIPSLCCSQQVNLRLLVTDDFPYYPPRIAAWPAPPVLSWPHLEEAGLLCLLSEHAAFSADTSVEADTIKLIESAVRLVNDSTNGQNAKEFEDEFNNYWVYWIEAHDAGQMHSLCRPGGPSRWVSAWHGQKILLVADDESMLLTWMKNRYVNEDLSKIKPQRIPLLWLPRALQPTEYPATVGAFLSVLSKLSVESQMVLELIKNEDLKHRSILFGFSGRTGIGMAGLRLGPPPKSLKNGFRNMPPDNFLLARYKGVPVNASLVNRLDSRWIHGRDHNPQASILGSKTVVILGLGSIGSSVAELLVKSGVGKMVLIDADILSAENVSRHVLGVESIGSSKAVELARKFTTRYPHIDVTGFKKTAVDIATENLDMLSNADLIVSTIGSWRAEGWLNAFSRRAAKFPPVLYGWTEAHASAGHAVIFFEKDGCLRCLTDGAGRLRIPVTRWPNHDTLLPVPACGGHFQPYGAVELAHIHGLVADLALQTLLGKVNKSKHRVWIGHRSLLDGVSKGEWSPDWINKYGDPGDGCYVKEVDIVAEPACTECGEQS